MWLFLGGLVNPDTWKLRKVTYYIWTTIFVCNVRCPWTDCGQSVGRRVSGVGWHNQTQYSHDLRQTTHQIKSNTLKYSEWNQTYRRCIFLFFPSTSKHSIWWESVPIESVFFSTHLRSAGWNSMVWIKMFSGLIWQNIFYSSSIWH